MARPDFLSRLPIWCCCVLAFCIPLPFIFGSVASILVILSVLIATPFRELAGHFRQRPILWMWMLYFVLHGLSYFYSTNKDQSLFDLESKLVFLLFPPLIGAGMNISRKDMEAILFFFVLGISATALFCIVQAALLWQAQGSTHFFFYHDLVKGLEANAVYVAWYVFCSLAALFFFRWESSVLARYRWLFRGIILLQIIFFILLSARSLLLLFLCFLVPVYLTQLRRKGVLSRNRLRALLVSFALALALLLAIPNPITSRFREVVGNDVRKAWLTDYRGDDQRFTNLTNRLFFWRVGLDNMNHHHLWWYGAGNGDVSLLQNQRMDELGIQNIYNPDARSPFYNVNLHNMYLQTLVMLGLPGLLVFLTMMLTPFFHTRRHPEQILWLSFQLCACLFMLQEAALQTQAGIIFFTFFSMVFWNRRWTTPKAQEPAAIVT